MMDCQKKFLLVVFLMGLIMVPTACERKTAPPEPMVQDVVLMEMPKRPDPPVGEDKKNPLPGEKNAPGGGLETVPRDDGMPPGTLSLSPSPSDALSQISLISDSDKADGQVVEIQKDTDSHDESVALDDATFQSLIQVETVKVYYSGEGKVDPFDPLIKDAPPPEKRVDVVEKEVPRRILTPLEKLDFSQMKLVAVMGREFGNVAMVQESSGKGYLVDIGTYIGKNSGQVVAIEKDKLLIQEQVKDYKGNTVERFQEMKLNKLVEDKG